MLASPRSFSSLIALSLIALLASFGLRYLFQQRTTSPLDFDVETLLLSGRAKDRRADWEEVNWAVKGAKRKLKPRLPRRDQEMRDLIWGDVQFLHTTDIHGFYLPHHSPVPPATSYSADWADWVSFIERMRDKARSEGRDLVVVDTGDLVTGHGLSDARHDVPPGLFSNQIFALADYDVLTVGNHELYTSEGVQALRSEFIPIWGDHYVTSNVIVTSSANGTSLHTSPLGSQYTSFVLPQTGLRLTSLGVLFGFSSPVEAVSIQPPTSILSQPWFKELMQSQTGRETDIWLIAGHMPLDGPEDEWDELVEGMRQWDSVGQKPVVGLGGHTHLRNCRQDSNTMILQSGRYHETAGFLSLAFPERQLASRNGSRTLGAPLFSRRYIDLNPLNLAHHLGFPLSNVSLTTPFGHYVRHIVHTLAAKWKLDEVHGFAPQDWFLERYDAKDERSILRGTKDVLARVFKKTHETVGQNEQMRIILINSGSLRNDLRKGPCELLMRTLLKDENDQFTVSPFSDSFHSIHSVPLHLARRLITRLNGDAGDDAFKPDLQAGGGGTRLVVEVPDEDDRSEGYVTLDACGVDGRDGDDTIHRPVPLVPFEPPYIVALASASLPPQSPSTSNATQMVEIVTVQYLLPRLLGLLNELAAELPPSAALESSSQSSPPSRKWKATLLDDGKVKTRDLWRIEAEDLWSEDWEGKWDRYGREAERRGHEVYDV